MTIMNAEHIGNCPHVCSSGHTYCWSTRELPHFCTCGRSRPGVIPRSASPLDTAHLHRGGRNCSHRTIHNIHHTFRWSMRELPHYCTCRRRRPGVIPRAASPPDSPQLSIHLHRGGHSSSHRTIHNIPHTFRWSTRELPHYCTCRRRTPGVIPHAASPSDSPQLSIHLHRGGHRCFHRTIHNIHHTFRWSTRELLHYCTCGRRRAGVIPHAASPPDIYSKVEES